MSEKRKIKLKLKEIILATVKRRKPKSVEELIKLVQQTYPHFGEEIADLVIKLQNENKISLTNDAAPTSISSKVYLFSSKTIWYWVTIAVAVAAIATVFAVHESVYPMAYIRSAFGLLLVLFLPGFTFIKAIFPYSVPIKTSSEYFDIVELVALSLGASLAITPIVGLMLYHSYWGIGEVPTTLSLLGLVVFFATVAMLREHQKENV